MEESQRQKKIGTLLQKDLAAILQETVQKEGLLGVLISVTKISVSIDLSMARVYLSIFPSDKSKQLLTDIQSNAPLIKHNLAQKTKHQLRKMPNLEFRLDDSLDYIENIEQSLQGAENPIKNPNLLQKRKKI